MDMTRRKKHVLRLIQQVDFKSSKGEIAMINKTLREQI